MRGRPPLVVDAFSTILEPRSEYDGENLIASSRRSPNASSILSAMRTWASPTFESLPAGTPHARSFALRETPRHDVSALYAGLLPGRAARRPRLRRGSRSAGVRRARPSPCRCCAQARFAPRHYQESLRVLPPRRFDVAMSCGDPG